MLREIISGEAAKREQDPLPEIWERYQWSIQHLIRVYGNETTNRVKEVKRYPLEHMWKLSETKLESSESRWISSK